MLHQLDLWPEQLPTRRVSWSISRDRCFQQCLRKYFYSYVGAQGGSKPSASKEVREIYVLKHLRNRHMWVGELVHEAIEWALRAWKHGKECKEKDLVARSLQKMRLQYAESLQQKHWKNPRQYCGLLEHEYDEVVPEEEWQRQRSRMQQCLANFFNLNLIRQIKNLGPKHWLAVENLESFFAGNVLVWAKPDFVWSDKAGKTLLVDWKTGAHHTEDERLQVAVYGLFAKQRWKKPDHLLMGQVVHLSSNDVWEMPLTPKDLQQAKNTLLASAQKMQEFVPKPGVGRTLSKEDFTKTKDWGLCQRCNFRRLCGV